MITLKEIAAELGVSVSTVSRVVTDKDRVDPEKRKLIKAALEKYNYIPNDNARGLRGKASRSIGIIVPALQSAFYTEIISAAQETAYNNSYTPVVCCGGNGHEKDMARMLKNKQIENIMCATVLPDAVEFYGRLFSKSSVVLFDTDDVVPDQLGYIGFDCFGAGKRLSEYILDLGHTRILVLSHTENSERRNGMLAAIRERGISLPDNFTVSGLTTMDAGYRVCLDRFTLPVGERPTAVLATDNSLAYAAIMAVREKSLEVPRDVSVACFDAYDPTGILTPRLTCIMQPTALIGRRAAEMLIHGKCEHLTVDVDFISGTSCRSIRA